MKKRRSRRPLSKSRSSSRRMRSESKMRRRRKRIGNKKGIKGLK